jgi:hypothetical protein
MNTARKAIRVSTVLGSMATGGLLGATVLAPTASNAATTSTTATNGSTSAGTFHSNENAAHEKTESAAREAQENAGQMPTVP